MRIDPQPSPFQNLSDVKRVGVCLPQEQYEKYGQDHHISARVLCQANELYLISTTKRLS